VTPNETPVHVADRASGAEPSRGLASFGSLLCIALGIAAFRLWFAGRVPLTGEEAYYWQWSRHLALGYYDHPPLIAYTIFLATWVGGNAVRVVRVTPLLFHTVTALLVYRLGKDVEDENAGWWGGVLFLLAPYFAVTGMMAIPDAALLCFWTLTLLCAERALLRDSPVYWVATGLALGLSLLAKFHGFLMLGVGGVFLLVARDYRRTLARPWPYVAAGIALLMFAPMLIWNAQHEWITFAFQFSRRHKVSLRALKYSLEFIFSPLLLIGILAYPLCIWGIVSGLRQARIQENPGRLLLGIAAAFPLVYFGLPGLVIRMNAPWAAMGFIPALILGARAAAQARRPLWRRLPLASAIVSGALVAFAQVLLLIPDVIPRQIIYALRPKRVNTSHLDRMYGWKGLGVRVREELNRLPASGRPFVWSPRGRSLASSIAFYTPGHPEVHVLRGSTLLRTTSHQYHIWTAGADLAGRDALCVSDRPVSAKKIQALFTSYAPLDPLEIRHRGTVRETFYLYRCAGLRKAMGP